MKEIIMWTADFMKSRPIYPMIRKGLNVLFVTSITSWWYMHCYKGDLLDPLYNKLDWNSYLIKGQFFIPISMFLIVYIGTWLFSFLIYKGLTTWQGVRIKKIIVEYQATHEDGNIGSEAITRIGSFFTHEKLG